MSQKQVVRRTSTTNRRKNTDSDRSDSGCFEDVDVLQMANRPSQTPGSTPTKSTTAQQDQLSEKTEQEAGNDRSTGNDAFPNETPSTPDECAEDSEFHAILERLAEVTKNPGDLYRLCFSSRLSFCGLSLGGMEEQVSPAQPELTSRENSTDDTSEFVSEGVLADATAQPAKTGVTIPETGDEAAEHRNCGDRKQCVEVLSLLSSFVEKAKEDPAVFNQSGLGRSLLGQLSSLLTTLEEAKKNPNFTSCLQSEYPNDSSHSSQQLHASEGNRDSPIAEQDSSSDSVIYPARHSSSGSTDDGAVSPPVFEDVTESTSLITHDNEESRATTTNRDGEHVSCADVNNDGEKTSAEKSGDHSGDESGDVVTNGRRAVTPYSWDYGDIWEEELQRAQSTDTFPPGRFGEPGSNMPGDPLMPTFEEIRDELFHDAGFVVHEGRRGKAVHKRRSRSADARSSEPFRSEPLWSECEDLPASHSPFVRTVYQHGLSHDSRLTRSGSSLLSGGTSMTINYDRSYGRQVRMYPESLHRPRSGQLDDSSAFIVKEAVAGTSTFRGPKPWSMLKRRPSGLRRRSSSPACSEPSFPNEFQRTRLDSHGDSESSDSPNYVSAASSDCLTTDDSSSLTSSHYCGASSVQSSPTVSNRNSACFSDTGSSDLNDLRRVVYQDSSPELYPGDKYPRDRYPVGCGSSARERFFSHDPIGQRMERSEGSLDQRFGRMGRASRAFSEPGDSRLNMVGKSHLRKAYQRAENYRGNDPSALRNLQHNAVRKWSRERAASPLIVRSDSDLNHLARVQFIGDSYSRSNISKNLRHSREASRSPSPSPTHTRVLSCEILQNDKRDVYTKVNLSRSVHDEERAIDQSPSPLLGRDGTRRSWHGHSPQRGFSRAPHASGNPAPRRIQSERCGGYAAGLVDRRRQLFRPKKLEADDQAIHATLVEVKNLRANPMRSYHSAGNFRSSYDSDDSRHWSEFRAPAIGSSLRGDYPRQFPRNPLINRNRRAEVLSERSGNGSFGNGRPRMRPDQASATTAQTGSFEKKEMSSAYQRHEGFQHAKTLGGAPEKTIAKDRNSPVRNGNGSKSSSKEHATHIVKETSFVGPSTFTRYQSPSNPPSLSMMHRSKSFNEKDSPSRRRAQEAEAYRRRALGTSIGDACNNTSPDHPLASESDSAVVRRPDRRRRYSEGASRSSGSGDAPLQAYVVDESYCDPRRESIREGTYSISSAESARNGSKLARSRLETPAANEDKIDRMQDQVLNQNEENKPGECHLEEEREDGKKYEPGKHLLKNDVNMENKHVDREDVEKMEVQSCNVQTVDLNSTNKGDKDSGNTTPRSKDQDGSPVWRAKEESVILHGVNVFIDYRSKKPMSVEYEVKDSRPELLSRMSKLGLSKKGKANMKQLSNVKPTTEPQIQKVCVAGYHQPALVADVSTNSKENSEEFRRRRLSRKEKHVLDVSSVVHSYERELKPCEDFKLLPVASSPVPYRRDKTIVYTDARSSVGSDTDSISHDSTISSSGSDVTVILNDDTDITADDFKQLAQNGSEIGIEIGSLEVDSSDDFPESSDSSPEKNSAGSAEWVARLPDSIRSPSCSEPSTNFPDLLRSSKDCSALAGSLTRAPKEPGNKRSFGYDETGNKQSSNYPSKETGANASIPYSPRRTGNTRSFATPSEETGNNEKTADPFKQGSKLRDIYLKYEKTVGEGQSTAGPKNAEPPSNTSSHECRKESGASSTESSKGKHSSGKNGESGKGLFSRLKSIRNSFRGKKTEGKSVEKSGKSSKHSTRKAGKAPIPDIRTNLGSRSLPIFDSNSNEMCDGAYTVSKLTDRTKSTDFSTKGVSNEELTVSGELSRTSHEPWQPSGTLRNAVGVMSWSSDQLNSLRVRKPSKKAAKSLEVLLETCI